MISGTFEKVPADTFKEVAIGAGVLLSSFTPTSPSIDASKIICATDGGVNVSLVPEFLDMADGMDNVPANTKELKVIKSYSASISGTARTINAGMTKRLLGGCAISGASNAAIDVDSTARVVTAKYTQNGNDLTFADIWFVFQYGTDAQYGAICLKNALNTSGFVMQTSDGDKASFSFTFTAHGQINAPQEIFAFYLLSASSTSGT